MAKPSAAGTAGEGSPRHNNEHNFTEPQSTSKPGAAPDSDGAKVVGSRVLTTTADPLREFRRLLEEIGILPDECVSICRLVPAVDGVGGEFPSTFGTASGAPARAAAFMAKYDVFFGVSPLREGIGVGKRGSASDVTRIAALWCDLDLGKLTPEAMDAVELALCAALGGAQWVARVSSGSGGRHLYWRLAKYGADDHVRVLSLLARWGVLVKATAVENGGTADSVFDASRVLRVPGTKNWKDPDNPKPVTVEFWDTNNPDVEPEEVTLDDLEEALERAGIPDEPINRPQDEQAAKAVPYGDWEESASCPYALSMIAGWAKDTPKARHPWLLSQCVRLYSARRLGCLSRAEFERGVQVLKARFEVLCRTTQQKREPKPYEVAGCLQWAQQRVENRTIEASRANFKHEHHDGTVPGEPVDMPGDGDGDGDEDNPKPEPEDGLWDRSPELAHIRLAALRGMAAPEAVLFTVLARIGQTIPPHVCTPAFIGGWGGSLNSLTALVGRSASGKGAAFSVAEACVRLPVSIHTTTVGSGEGLAKKYVRWDAKAKAYVRVRSAVLFTASEIKGLKALMERNGATLEDQLLKMYSGEQLGYAYADDTKANEVEAHTYRGGLVTGVQVANASILFGMAESGMPQRFEWARVEDPDITRAAHGPQPDPLVLPDMDWSLNSDLLIPWREFPMVDEVGEEVALTREQNMQGLVAELDGHGMFTRVKLAARVAVLHGRQEVTSWDWEVSGLLKARSDRARDWARGELGRIAQGSRDFENMLRGQEAVAVRETVHAAVVKGARNAIRSKLSRAGGATRRALKDTCGSQYREGLGEALEALLANGEVVKDGSEYRLKESS